MIRPPRSPAVTTACSVLAACVLALNGCADQPKAPAIKAKQVAIAPKVVPPFMKGTIWEKVDVGNTEPFQVSGYGLVANLDNTGDSTAPTAVTQYMIKQMIAHKYGSALNPGWENQTPQRVLASKRVAIVQVVGLLPPGIRADQSFDVMVQALPNNQTSSLAGGSLYLSELKINGADPSDPFGKINDYALAKGYVFVNPAYALNKDPRPGVAVRQSLRTGTIMDGGIAKYDRPLFLRLRQPESRIARFIEQRLISRFQFMDNKVAKAEDEGVVELYVPVSYRGDWVHFSRLATHLYMDSTPEVAAHKAKMLVEEAHKPDALLEDISYCWEGIGPPALPFISSLLADPKPDIAFAAARAAAYIGDPTGAAGVALLEMARTPNHPFQISAIEALGGLTPSASINQMLHELLDSDIPLVRIEAYKVMARNHDPAVQWEVVNSTSQKFSLDIVPSHGPPIIYATRTGVPRIAIIGKMPQILSPVMFSAMGDRLTISSREIGQSLTIFFRPAPILGIDGLVHDEQVADPVKATSGTSNLAEVVELLGGMNNAGEKPLNFTYSEIIAILQRLHEEKKLVAIENGQFVPAAFVLQDPSVLQNMINSAPSLDNGRPQGEDHPKVSQNYDPADAAMLGRK